MSPVEVVQGSSPIILGLPHTGTHVPEEIAARLNEEGRKLRDTDWHVDTLYRGLLADVTTVRATFHRYVIDPNRDPSGRSLYPGQNTTGLVPLTDFDDQPIWKKGEEPGETDVAARLAAFHRPYHAALEGEIARVRALHGVAILYDCHSIRSRCPFLFEGVLPDFNIGTDNGRSCAPQVEAAAAEICSRAAGYASVVNGRFRGGWTTRHYGRPADGVHAIQMELAQSTYLASESLPFAYDETRAARLRPHLAAILERLAALAPSLKENKP
ncbi:N-formylglutamate deformylase [Chelativorans intermedius]|uniref:N-formylglutamate deformylase n=1 Tax=Chelativorans intermedius TaxID=515947 RepID=A0ABV6D9K5_9HYPH|nr:N-formylglutamate deformylase [Chelativorans intermedius]MCT8999171.1 N-formylglutamate deformylase [Chelativorans intermedius]